MTGNIVPFPSRTTPRSPQATRTTERATARWCLVWAAEYLSPAERAFLVSVVAGHRAPLRPAAATALERCRIRVLHAERPA